MADLAVTPAEVRAVKIIEQDTGPAAEAINSGEYVRYNTASGKVEKGNATTAAEARDGGIALTTVNQAGLAVTFLRKGIVYLGSALGALNYDADVFLSNTDGALADAAGTVSKVVGAVVPIWGETTPAKGLRVDL